MYEDWLYESWFFECRKLNFFKAQDFSNQPAGKNIILSVSVVKADDSRQTIDVTIEILLPLKKLLIVTNF